MKTLKGLLTAVLALSMSTGFATPIGEQTFQATDNNSEIQIRFADELLHEKVVTILDYNDLSESGQKEMDKAVDEFCATAPEDITKYQNRIEKVEPYIGGSFLAAGTGLVTATGVMVPDLIADNKFLNRKLGLDARKIISMKNFDRFNALGLTVFVAGLLLFVGSNEYRKILEGNLEELAQSIESRCKSKQLFKR